MKTSTHQALKALAHTARNIAADMRQTIGETDSSGSNVETFIFTKEQLAQAVYRAEAMDIPLSVDQIEHVLDIALRCKLGLFCAGTSGVQLDLGNGHVMTCSVRPTGARA